MVGQVPPLIEPRWSWRHVEDGPGGEAYVLLVEGAVVAHLWLRPPYPLSGVRWYSLRAQGRPAFALASADVMSEALERSVAVLIPDREVWDDLGGAQLPPINGDVTRVVLPPLPDPMPSYDGLLE